MPKPVTLVDYARSQCIRFLGTDDAAAMATALNGGGLALSAFEPFVILVHDTGCLDQALAAVDDGIAARIRDALDALGQTGSESFSDVTDDAWEAWYADHPYPDQLVRIAKFRSCWKRMHDPETIAERERLLARYGLHNGRDNRR